MVRRTRNISYDRQQAAPLHADAISQKLMLIV